MIRRRRWYTAALAGAAVVGSFAGTRSRRVETWERLIAHRVRTSRGERADVFIAFTTDLGSLWAVLGTAGALAARGRRRASLDVVGSGAIAWGVAQAAKHPIQRARPYIAEVGLVRRLVVEPSGTSWPSGHAAVGGAVATALAAHLPPPMRPAAGVLGGYVAASRVYVGVHYPLDVVAGLALGTLSAELWVRLRDLVWPEESDAEPARHEPFVGGSGPEQREALADDGSTPLDDLTGDAAQSL